MKATFYAWADRARGIGLLAGDHTWVTTYEVVPACPPDAKDGDYWYCWGECHATPPVSSTARLLRQGPGSLDFARFIGRPNDAEESVGLRYGIDGVCHQMANRILFATGSDDREPLSVAGAAGYNLSVALFGVYGGKGVSGVPFRTKERWEALIRQWRDRTRGDDGNG